MKKNIGIPKALLFHKYGDKWKNFFNILGYSVILSNETNKVILNEGVKRCIDEACLPVKVFYGHILDLAGRVNQIFVPRYISTEAKTKTCPKLIGLPDMIRNNFPSLRIVSPAFNIKKKSEKLSLFLLALKLSKSPIKALKATRGFFYPYKETKQRIELDPSKSNIGLISHAYVLKDNYINMDIRDILKSMDVNVIGTEDLSKEILDKENDKLNKPLYWSYEKEVLGSAYYFAGNDRIDGVIHLTAFSCGPDSVVAEIIGDYCRKKNKPYLKLMLDEHTGRAGFITRIEAFFDMLQSRR